MSPETKDDIQFQLGQLDKIHQSLKDIEDAVEWDDRETAFVAVQLHGYYNGFERILRMLTDKVLSGEGWHARLLAEFQLEPFLPYDFVVDLMRFRHVFRGSYLVNLDPIKVGDLRVKFVETHDQIHQFIVDQLDRAES